LAIARLYSNNGWNPSGFVSANSSPELTGGYHCQFDTGFQHIRLSEIKSNNNSSAHHFQNYLIRMYFIIIDKASQGLNPLRNIYYFPKYL